LCVGRWFADGFGSANGLLATLDLAAWNLPNAAAFERAAARVMAVGYVSNFPTVDDGEQEVVVTVSRLQ
jgi:hypothetical protein